MSYDRVRDNSSTAKIFRVRLVDGRDRIDIYEVEINSTSYRRRYVTTIQSSDATARYRNHCFIEYSSPHSPRFPVSPSPFRPPIDRDDENRDTSTIVEIADK